MSMTQSLTALTICPNLASFAYVYDLPVGLGRHFLNHPGVVNQIIGGWKVSGIQQYQSGQPESIEDPRTDESLEEVGSGGYNTPDTISGVPGKTAAKAHGHFDPAITILSSTRPPLNTPARSASEQ